MTIDRIAFVGDVHGNLLALKGMIAALGEVGEIDRIVFLGDYINKGGHSADVIQFLLESSRVQPLTLLRGNHEDTLLAALDTGCLAAFLKMGGASTIRSYVGRPVRPDVISDFRSCIPPEHIVFLRSMPDQFETKRVIASHKPPVADGSRFRISAHIPVGDEPLIESNSASIDTGCGPLTGRLTALIWPSLAYVQVDAAGLPV